jgi:hypothetical protein
MDGTGCDQALFEIKVHFKAGDYPALVRRALGGCFPVQYLPAFTVSWIT